MRFERTFMVDAPPEVALQVLKDVVRWAEWNGTTKSVTPLDPGPVHPGGRYRVELERVRPAVWTVTRLDDRGFEWACDISGVHSVAGHEVTGQGAGSGVTLWIEQRGWPTKLMGFYLRRVANRNLEIEARSLQREAARVAAG